jgi:hypothetical protein
LGELADGSVPIFNVPKRLHERNMACPVRLVS